MCKVWFSYKIYLYVTTSLVGVKGKVIGDGHRQTNIQTKHHTKIEIDWIKITAESTQVTYDNPKYSWIIIESGIGQGR